MIRLQIQDKDGKVVQDDELVVENGDILLCQINNTLSKETMTQISKQIAEGFRQASKKANNGQIVPLLYDSAINFKILKIQQENNIPNKDIKPPKYDIVSEFG